MEKAIKFNMHDLESNIEKIRSDAAQLNTMLKSEKPGTAKYIRIEKEIKQCNKAVTIYNDLYKSVNAIAYLKNVSVYEVILNLKA